MAVVGAGVGSDAGAGAGAGDGSGNVGACSGATSDFGVGTLSLNFFCSVKRFVPSSLLYNELKSSLSYQT